MIVVSILFILLGGGHAEAAPQLSSPELPSVRVRLERDLEEVRLAGRAISWEDAPVTAKNESLKVRLKKLNDFPLWEINQANEVRRLMSRRMRIDAKVLKMNAQAVPRSVELVAKNNGRFDVLATLDLDEYLFGVLPSEMPASWPMEALKAQAVASRSYTLSALSSGNYHYHLEATVNDQVYQFLPTKNLLPSVSEKIRTALRATQNEVLIAPEGEVLRAYFHADCGGHTEEPHLVWGNGERRGTAHDKHCPRGPHASWQVTIDEKTLAQSLQLTPPIETIKVHRRSPSGRVLEMSVTSQSGQTVQLSGQKFRQKLGFNKIKSANFQTSFSNQKLTVRGRGHGHGVGLCQWGARYLAEQGFNYRQILRHYYPNAKVIRTDYRMARIR